MDNNRALQESSNWQELNRQYMVHAVGSIAWVVEQHLDLSPDRKGKMPNIKRSSLNSLIEQLIDTGDNSADYRLNQLIARFNLSDTETFIILVCMAAELIPSFRHLWATYHGDLHRTYPTFGAIASLFERFDSRAMAHKSNLEAWKLLRIGEANNLSFNEFPLSIDVDIYNYLLGEPYSDRTVESVTRSVSNEQLERLSDEGSDPIVDKAVTLFRRSSQEQYGTLWRASTSEMWDEQSSSIQLSGTDDVQKRSIVSAIASRLGGGYLQLNHFKVPTQSEQLYLLAIRLGRFVKITGSLLYIVADRLESEDKGRSCALRDLIETVEFPIVISTIEPMDWGIGNTFNHEVSVPDSSDQLALWHTYLTPQLLAELKPDLPKLVSQFNLSAPAIKAIASQLYIGIEGQGQAKTESAFESLWQACRVQARQKLDSLATRVESKTNWDNLILPSGVRKPLSDIVAQVGLKHLVYQKWGMGGNRGLGIAALFSGVSGTGKTTAVEAIANELKLDLYRIDLSTVISKYIGETEKNLRRIFDAAEAGGAILLFDEADALFGKRTEVKDSKDRHSNAEISYLLQKMEAYSGLAILTTNLPDAIDSAFKRRLRFVVEFAYPDAVAQERIWRSAFGGAAPTEGLDYRALAELNLTGGNIRSVALNAAFEAAQSGKEIGMKHIVSAALEEAKKLGNSTHKLDRMMSRLNLDQTSESDDVLKDTPHEVQAAPHKQGRQKDNDGGNEASNKSDYQVSEKSNKTTDKPNPNPTPTPTRRAKVDPFSQSRNFNPAPNRDYSSMTPQEILDSTAPYLRNNDPKTALSILRDALAYYPDDSGLNFWLGHINHEAKLDYTEAVTAFERASQGNGQWLNNPEGEFANWYWLAATIFKMPEGDMQRVYDLCDKYLKALPDGIYTQDAKYKHFKAKQRLILPDLDE